MSESVLGSGRQKADEAKNLAESAAENLGEAQPRDDDAVDQDVSVAHTPEAEREGRPDLEAEGEGGDIAGPGSPMP
ncbi:hypothetical protein [Georgenia thermotolerans]|uniref:Uncharacterized protein n=1 Tax=Georgenia thermotolerans TaxID=527326 RepID=A0A7J5UPQ1_9MICO|nr:hypothetical protein [Georgenia thermotolerans]KAE8764385.1 hypothetical protein GB883_09195 [Georgenia thermotolerans]